MPTKSTIDYFQMQTKIPKIFFSVIAMQSRGSISLENVK